MRFSSLPFASLLFSTVLASGAANAQGFGSVFTLDNDADDNRVSVALRLPGGGLFPFGAYSTGGEGTAGGLGSQGALAASQNGRVLLAVSPGSNEVSMFRVLFGVFLWRTDTEASGGEMPTSVAMHKRLVYVLNAGSDSVTGFRRVGSNLVPIPGATYGLSQAGAAAAQVGFSPDGDYLVVTERATDTIGVFPVLPNGRLGAGNFQPSAGQTPFGFAFRNDGTLVVSEAAGGAAGASEVSSYRICGGGDLQVVTGAADTNESAACWIAIPRNGQFAYTTNTGDGTVTGFALGGVGDLSLLDADGVTGDLGGSAAPIDAAFSRNGRLLYVLDAGEDRIRAFYRHNDGSLTPLPVSLPLEDGAAGLLAR